jgi:hypothetical protein
MYTGLEDSSVIITYNILVHAYSQTTVSVAERSKAWVCCRSLAAIVGSNPAGVWMSVSRECCLLSGRSLGRAADSSRGVLRNVACLNVIVKPR